MRRYILRKLAISIPLLAAISFLAFVLNNLSPADPAKAILHAQGVPAITGELIAETRAAYGMNQPFLTRYLNWLVAGMKLDFGKSYITGEPVWSMLGPALFNSLKLALASAAAIITLSILLGIVCAMREGTPLDRSVRGIAFVLTSMPSYWLAALMIWYFSVKLDWLPTSGMDSFRSFVLPVAVITVGFAGVYFRIIRSSVLSHMNEDYVLYGRACGLPEHVIVRHLLRNSLQAAIPLFGMAVPVLLGSTVVVENVFAWPGLGTLSVRAIEGRDIPVIQAYVLVLAVSFVLMNALSDMVNAGLNPKLRKDG